MLGTWEKQVPQDLSFEVVIVDDGSDDETPELLAGFRPNRFSLVTLRQENSGPAAARNYGLAASMGDRVLFAGDDIEPAPDLLQQHLDAHHRLRDDRWAVLGKVSWAPELELTSTMHHVDGVGAQQFSYHYMIDGNEYDFRHFYTSNVSVSRRLLDEESSGFSRDFSAAAFEDAEFSFRLSRRGMRIVYRAAAQAWHHHAYDAPSFFNRQVSCGRMAAVLIRKWPQTRRLIGVHEVFRSRFRQAFTFGARRRRQFEIEENLETLEKCVIDLAAAHDLPATAVVDPLLHPLFHYGYLKGFASATKGEETARRLCSYWFSRGVSRGVDNFRYELKRRNLELDEEKLRLLVDRFST